MCPHDSHHCEIPGDEIRSVRHHWAMSRSDFAELFRVQPGTIYVWECLGVTCRAHKFDYATFEILKLSRDVLGENNNE